MPELIDLTTPPRKRPRYDLDPSSSNSKYSAAYSIRSSQSSLSLRSLATSTPSDSPTNPFGLKRIAHFSRTLPDVSSFAQHLALRFQLVQCYGLSVFKNGPKDKAYVNAANTLRKDKDGVYRIVQVPLNYTFLHLHRLIYFLFGGMGNEKIVIEPDEESDLCSGPSSSASFLPRSRKRKRSSEASFEDEDTGHLFQVLKKITMQVEAQKPGEIRKGEVFAKLSNSYEDLDDELEMDNNADNVGEEGEDSWRAEDDLHLSSVWPSGSRVLERGIVYSHSPQTQIHITINTQKIPPRKGRSNLPHVFVARGLVRLPGYEKYLLNASSSGLTPEDINVWLDAEDFNKPHLFERFHTNAAKVDMPLSSIELPLSETPGSPTPSLSLSRSESSPMASSSLSYMHIPTTPLSTPSSSYDISFASEPPAAQLTSPSNRFPSFSFPSFPNSSPISLLKRRLRVDTHTPFPTSASEDTRRKMRRMEKRIKRDKKKLEEKVVEMKIKEAKEREKKEKERREGKEKEAKEREKKEKAREILVKLREERTQRSAKGKEVAIVDDDELDDRDAEGETEEEVDQLEEEEVTQLAGDGDGDEETLVDEEEEEVDQLAGGDEDEDENDDAVDEDNDQEELTAAGIFPIGIDQYAKEMESALAEPSPSPETKEQEVEVQRSPKKNLSQPKSFDGPTKSSLGVTRTRRSISNTNNLTKTETKNGKAPLFATRAEIELMRVASLRRR